MRPIPSRCHSHYAQQQQRRWQLALLLVDRQAKFQSMPWASLLLLPQPLLLVRTRQQRVSLLLLLLLLPVRVLHCEVQPVLVALLVPPQLWVTLLHQRPTPMCPPVHPGQHRQQPAL